jgi:hypothetical protein
MCFVLESESVSSTGFLEPLGTIDEKHSVLYAVFFAEFSEKDFRKAEVLRCSRLHVEEFVVIRVDCGVQPVARVVDLDHGFIDYTVIRAFALGRL